MDEGGQKMLVRGAQCGRKVKGHDSTVAKVLRTSQGLVTALGLRVLG